MIIFVFLCRNHNYKAENQDILVRCSWGSDPLVLWESKFGQKIKRGNIRKKRNSAKKAEEEMEEVPLLIDLDCEEEDVA